MSRRSTRVNRELLAALSVEFAERGIDLPLYWGNRNWKPYVADAVRHMRDDGVQRALVFTTSATASYSACRQYRGDLAQARAVAGEGAPELVKLRHFFDHPGFIAANADGCARRSSRCRPSSATARGWCSPRTRSRSR